MKNWQFAMLIAVIYDMTNHLKPALSLVIFTWVWLILAAIALYGGKE